MSERFDLVSLGEVMLRLDPGERRIAQARNFSVWEGGGEYNPARAFASCFGLRSAVVTALADNPVGRLIRNLIAEGGTDSRWVRMVPFDGIGESVRNGLNFTERGFGLRAPLGCSDRGHSAASQIKADDFDWDEIFSVTDRFHTGGIFASLSDTSTQTAAAAVAAARARGVCVSFDLNYRPSLWKARGGKEAAFRLFETFARQADFLFGSEEDYALLTGATEAVFPEVLTEILTRFPNLKGCGASRRRVLTASDHRWQCFFSDGKRTVSSREYGLPVLDRVGGGDGFVAGFLAASVYGEDLSSAVEWGAAHGALVMSTPGDVSFASAEEVRALAGGAERRIDR